MHTFHCDVGVLFANNEQSISNCFRYVKFFIKFSNLLTKTIKPSFKQVFLAFKYLESVLPTMMAKFP